MLNLISDYFMFLLYRVLKAQSDHRSRHEGEGSTKLIFNSKYLDNYIYNIFDNDNYVFFIAQALTAIFFP